MNKNWITNTHHRVLNLLSSKRAPIDRREKSELSLLLISVALTSFLMWGHCVTSYFFVSERLVFKVGFISSLVHMLSPLVYFYTGSVKKSLNTLLVSAFIYEVVWVIFSGGFLSHSILWFAALPLIAGVVAGKRLLFIWAMVSIFASATFFIAYMNGYRFASMISLEGFIIAKLFLSIGFISLCSVFMYAYIKDREKFYSVLMAKNDQIESLLTIMGHDISNPLTVVMITIKKLKKILGDVDCQMTRKYLNKLQSNSNDMANILAQIRDLQKLKAGKVQLDLEKIHLNTIIEDSIKNFEGELKDKNIEILYDSDRHNDVYVLGHETTLKCQIFNNLISNAIKFSDQYKPISIDVKSTLTNVEVTLRDSGVGISQMVLDDIFDRSTITTTIGTHGEKGSGFGMPIVKSFVELNGGQINISSKIKADYPHHHGTEISLSLQNVVSS